jgi:hypothetical protein
MTQAERDRLVALKKAKKKLITQKQAAEELGITERHVRRLLRAEAARRQGGGARTAGAAVEPQDQRGHRKGGGGHPVAAGVPRDLGRRWPRNTWPRNTASR